jgi:hypothetical protein
MARIEGSPDNRRAAPARADRMFVVDRDPDTRALHRVGLVGIEDSELERLLEKSAELRIRAAQLAETANLLIGQAEDLFAKAAALSERAHRQDVQNDVSH